ncbi:radical SAM protein [Macrococcoides caseolyticum]|uniref:Radical SAM core domain-containing protein n=1 Tax=Macrococcus caseolyticus (strain JCSC5402) TaxID=458233 RepID=B9EC63_MACCJ|nr:radical SAM protein [Macrococcus caseolyticus]BAH18671.1 conserved hypothetical protein [Macrococcus caseolyticus JCSC5402]
MKQLQFDFPIGMHLELSGKCNLKCKHCYVNSGAPGTVDISDIDLLDFFESYFNYSFIPQINITGGEAFIRQDLLKDILLLFSKNSPHTHIRLMTNGYFLKEDFFLFLKEIKNKVSFQISLDGANKASHERVRIVDGSWEKALDACLLIKKFNHNLQIATTITKSNFYEIEDMFKLSVILNADSIGIGPAYPLGRGIEDKFNLILSDNEIAEAKEQLYVYKKVYDKYLEVNLTTQLDEHFYNNLSIIKQDWFIIDNMGNVKIDTRLPYIVGNITKHPIDTLWKKVRHSFENNKVNEDIEKAIEQNTLINNMEKIKL